ncbi:MAG: assimilatory nitrite reductase small subunit [Myxococcaceae bacterium]|nr:assimilatory nitrite reductase small subunit [Myxococcaceae bacterium]
MISAQEQSRPEWVRVCALDEIVPTTGVCCLVGQKQVAVFRLADDRVFAIGNYDPFSRANVLSRGIVGDRQGRIKVASPIYKQSFALDTGECLDDETVSVPAYEVRVCDGIVEVKEPITRTLRTGNTPLLSEVQTG